MDRRRLLSMGRTKVCKYSWNNRTYMYYRRRCFSPSPIFTVSFKIIKWGDQLIAERLLDGDENNAKNNKCLCFDKISSSRTNTRWKSRDSLAVWKEKRWNEVREETTRFLNSSFRTAITKQVITNEFVLFLYSSSTLKSKVNRLTKWSSYRMVNNK